MKYETPLVMTNTDEVRTFDEWSEEGYRIDKGSKATGRNEAGVCTFDRSQVTDIYKDSNREKYSRYGIGYGEWDDMIAPEQEF